MDISLLKTFLEVARVRHFGKAAETLCVTQSAVSARIKLLEGSLGFQLFDRKRNDIGLTPAGVRLKKHAEVIVRNWARARVELALDPEFSRTLAVGSVFDLWHIFVKDWVCRLWGARTDLALQIEIHPSEALIHRLVTGGLDLVFLFEAPSVSGLVFKQVRGIPLVMVSDRPMLRASDAVQKDYLMVDWGTAFSVAHAEHFPDMPAPGIRVGLGVLALELLLEKGGTAYLPEQMAREPMDRGRLHAVADAPVIERFAYAVYRPETEGRAELRTALHIATANLN